MFYTHNHLCHLSSRERHTNNSHLCILLSCSSDKSSPHSSHVCESSAFVSPNEQLDECLTSPSTESSSSPMSPCVDNLSSHHNNWSLLTKCHSSCKYTCSVYTHSHTSSSSPSPCTRDQCKSYCQSNNMQRYTDITSTCNRKSNNNGTFNSFYKHTLIWSLLVSSFILLPLVNASSINTFSSSSVHVNPSSSSSSLSTASKSSPLTMTASGVSSSSSSSSNTDTRNAASGPWTNQYQETNPLSTFTATSSSSSSSHQNSNANLIINSNQFSWLTREAISEVKRVFNERIHKYNESFIDLLITSKKEFHQMFTDTYGLLYQRHAAIFTDMFQKLENFYKTGSVKLNEVFDSFFHLLYSKMFQVLNSQYTFDDNYLSCVSEKMEEMKPFGDHPKKIKLEVTRSFIATRAFVQSMIEVSNVLGTLETVMMSSSNECSKSLDLFSSCPDCLNTHSASDLHHVSSASARFSRQQQQQQHSVKFCPSVCTTAMYKCLNFNEALNNEWNRFVSALVSLLNRLETSFNIETVVSPIDIKISEAVMNFQDNGHAISQKLFEQCGKPKIGKRSINRQHRVKRWSSNTRGSSVDHSSHDSSDDSDDDDDTDDTHDTSRSHPTDSASAASRDKHLLPSGSSASSSKTTSPGEAIDELLREVRNKVKKTKDYWKRLPSIICSHKRIRQVTQQTNCWNGSQIIENDVEPSVHFESPSSTGKSNTGSNGNRNQKRASISSTSNSDYHPNTIFKNQITKLKSITNVLTFACAGMNPQPEPETMIDDEELIPSDEGSGEGSGDDEDDDDDDDPSGEVKSPSPMDPLLTPSTSEKPSINREDETSENDIDKTNESSTDKSKSYAAASHSRDFNVITFIVILMVNYFIS